MTWDMGVRGVALLLVMSAVAAVASRALWRGRFAPWAWGVTWAAFVVWNSFVSEVWFGWATQEELQPNIDGLSFDEVLLLGCLAPLGVLAVTRLVRRRRVAPHVRSGGGTLR